MSLTIHVTRHALDRYRQRFDPAATEEQIALMARAAQPAPTWVRHCFGEGSEGSIYSVSGPVLFVLRKAHRKKLCVVTVVSLPHAEAMRRSMGKKELKRSRRRGGAA